MKQKDLAKGYALARLQGRLSGDEISFCENKVFTEGDIETAFNAGRESVVENIPSLKWEYLKDGSLRANTLFGYYNIDKDNYGIANYIVSSMFSQAKVVFGKQNAIQAASEDYKKRIKQALGL